MYSGALDSLGVKRIQYQSPSGKATFIEELVNYADSYKKSMSDSDNSLFGEDVSSFRPERPVIPAFNEDMSSDEQLRLELLGKERSLVGMYLSEHPLKKYALEMKILSTASLNKITELLEEAREKQKGRKITLTGYITSTERKVGKKGVYATTVLEDLEGNWNMSLFGKSLEQLGHLLKPHTAIIVEGEIVPKYKKLPEDPKEAEKVKAEKND